MSTPKIDYTNAKFGEVTVICQDSDYIQPSGRRRVQWKCQCSCGKIFSVTSVLILQYIIGNKFKYKSLNFSQLLSWMSSL